MIESTLFLAFLADLFLVYILLTKASKKESNYSFAFATMSVGFWTLGILFFRLSPNLKTALFWNREFIFASGLIASNFLQFSLVLTGVKMKNFQKVLIHVPNIFILIGVFMPNILIKGIVVRDWGKESILGNLYILFAIYFSTYIIYGLYRILRTIPSAKEPWKNQLKYVFWATLLTSIVGTYFNLFLILIGNYKYVWVGPYNSLILAAVVTYAVAKEHLFDIDLATHYIFTWACSVITAAGIFLVSYFLIKAFPTGIFLQVSLLTFSSVLGAAYFPKYFAA